MEGGGGVWGRGDVRGKGGVGTGMWRQATWGSMPTQQRVTETATHLYGHVLCQADGEAAAGPPGMGGQQRQRARRRLRARRSGHGVPAAAGQAAHMLRQGAAIRRRGMLLVAEVAGRLRGLLPLGGARRGGAVVDGGGGDRSCGACGHHVHRLAAK